MNERVCPRGEIADDDDDDDDDDDEGCCVEFCLGVDVASIISSGVSLPLLHLLLFVGNVGVFGFAMGSEGGG